MSLTYLWKCAAGVSRVWAGYCLELLETYICLFSLHVTSIYRYIFFFFLTVTSLLRTVKCKGYCTSDYNHHVSSESTWVGESLGCMCLMTAGSEVEWRQWFQEVRVGWGRARCDYSLYEVVITTCALLQRVKDRARSNMRELVGHALWQKANGREDGSHVKLRSQKSKRNETVLIN